MSTCDCYVRHLDHETRFGLHYGAHNLACPAYRRSLDPVDRANDAEFREHAEPALWNRLTQRQEMRETRGACEDAPCCGCCGPGTGGPGDYYSTDR